MDMLGCLRRIGCLIVLLVLAVVAWLLRDRWVPVVFGTRTATTAVWEPATPEGATRARSALESLGKKSGPVFVNLKAEDVAGLLLAESAGHLPASVQGVEATVEGDQVHLRGTMSLEDIKGLDI